MEKFQIKLKKHQSIKFCDEEGRIVCAIANYATRPLVFDVTKFALSYYFVLDKGKFLFQAVQCSSYKIEEVPDSIESV